MRWAAVFICHFQKQQIGKLFQVSAVAYAIIPEGVAEGPYFGYDGGGGGRRDHGFI
jgi:hypothetical protein